MSADWFHDLMGFKELPYEETRANLEVAGTTLRSQVNNHSYAVGVLETPSLAELRDRAASIVDSLAGTLRVSNVVGDVGRPASRSGQPARAVPGRVAVQPAGDDGAGCHA